MAQRGLASTGRRRAAAQLVDVSALCALVDHRPAPIIGRAVLRVLGWPPRLGRRLRARTAGATRGAPLRPRARSRSACAHDRHRRHRGVDQGVGGRRRRHHHRRRLHRVGAKFCALSPRRLRRRARHPGASVVTYAQVRRSGGRRPVGLSPASSRRSSPRSSTSRWCRARCRTSRSARSRSIDKTAECRGREGRRQ